MMGYPLGSWLLALALLAHIVLMFMAMHRAAKDDLVPPMRRGRMLIVALLLPLVGPLVILLFVRAEGGRAPPSKPW